jgi:hypothetical protein
MVFLDKDRTIDIVKTHNTGEPRYTAPRYIAGTIMSLFKEFYLKTHFSRIRGV